MTQTNRPATGSARPASHRPLALVTLVLGLLVACLAFGARAARADEALDASVPVYRIYNRSTGEHLLTADENEKNYQSSHGWRYEGIAFRTPATGDEVYRLYNTATHDHLYTTDAHERDVLSTENGWRYEGVKFHVIKADPGNPTTAYPVYRLWNTLNKGVGTHLWTLDENEYQTLPQGGSGTPAGAWKQEGVAWYATGPFEAAPKPSTPYDTHGALSVRGTDIVDEYGRKFQLRGMSTHGLSFTEEGVPFKDYVNRDAFQTLRDDWGANCVRLAMYTESYMGYCNGGNKEELKGIVRRGVNAATDLGMYVIIDWHILENGNPTAREGDAREFFDQMSREFKDHGNVLYEICNEPNGGVDWYTIKGYAERIIPVIRANDPDAIVIVGTPEWSQRVDSAAADRIWGPSGENTLYALHFYANTHTQWLRDRMNAALDAGLPIFISEFGTCDASGNGGLNFGEAQQWLDLANRRNVSWMNWSLCLKNESASAIQPWCKKLSGWETWELTDSGNWVRGAMRAAAGL